MSDKLMIMLALALPVLMGLGVGETSNHQDMLLPFGNAYEEFRKDGCVSITRKKLSPVTQYKADIDTVIISGQVVRITCKRPDPAPSEVVDAVEVEVSWSRPEVRENGDILTPGEISHYEVHLYNDAGGLEVFTAESSPWRRDLIPGIYRVRLACVDTGSVRSELTDAVQIKVTNP